MSRTIFQSHEGRDGGLYITECSIELFQGKKAKKLEKKDSGIAVKELSREASSRWVVLGREHLASKDFYADKLWCNK